MTKRNYDRRAEQLVNLVNNRRVQVGKEVLRAEHIMRAVRLVVGNPPSLKWDSEFYRQRHGIDCPEKSAAWAERWEREFSHRWRKTAQGLVPA